MAHKELHNYSQSTRREALQILSGATTALLAGGRFVSGAPARQLAPASGLLKKRFKSRTINVHTHLSSAPYTQGTQGAAPPLKRIPDSELPTLTAEDRAVWQKYLTRYKYDLWQFDSPQQEDLYARKYTYYVRKNPPPPQTFEQNAVNLLREMDEAGLDTSVVLVLDFAGPRMATGPIDPSTEHLELLMTSCAESCKKHPGRFIPFIGIDVRRGKDAPKLFEKAVKQYGFRGAGEIVGTLWQTKPNDPKFYPLYEFCAGQKIPVMIDNTMDRGFSDPPIYEDILRDFPKLVVAAGGAGIRVPPVEIDGVESPSRDRMLQLANKHENLWLDLDDWQVMAQPSIEYYLQYLRRALDGPARNRIMFGSDYAVYSWMYSEKEWIDALLKHADKGTIKFKPEELELFFSKNAMNYLGLRENEI